MRNENILQKLNKLYPAGSRVEFVRMNDKYAPPVGTQGNVIGIDSIGNIMVDWDNGSRLNIVPDSGNKIRKAKTARIEVKSPFWPLTVRLISPHRNFAKICV